MLAILPATLLLWSSDPGGSPDPPRGWKKALELQFPLPVMSFFNNMYAFYNVHAVLVQQLMCIICKYPHWCTLYVWPRAHLAICKYTYGLTV